MHTGARASRPTFDSCLLPPQLCGPVSKKLQRSGTFAGDHFDSDGKFIFKHAKDPVTRKKVPKLIKVTHLCCCVYNARAAHIFERKGDSTRTHARTHARIAFFVADHQADARSGVAFAETAKERPKRVEVRRMIALVQHLAFDVSFIDACSCHDHRPDEHKRLFLNFKSLLQRCLMLDPNNRITATQALKHNFIKSLGKHKS